VAVETRDDDPTPDDVVRSIRDQIRLADAEKAAGPKTSRVSAMTRDVARLLRRLTRSRKQHDPSAT
jgi:hypothetical protein